MLHVPIAAAGRLTFGGDPEIIFRMWSPSPDDELDSALPINGGVVHVWIIPLAPSDCGRSGERLRKRTAGHELRRILSRYLGCKPNRIELAGSLTGRPYLASPFASLDFNLSHSGEWAALAVTGARLTVGIDVERMIFLPDLDRLLAAICSPRERMRLAALCADERLRSFFMLWTRREALTKAGLVEAPLEASARPPRGASVIAFEPARGYAGALAVVPAAVRAEGAR